MEELPTTWTKGNLQVDLDQDGDLDLVFAHLHASAQQGSSWATDSSIFYTTGTDPWAWERVGLPTVAAHGVSAGDLDGDGWLDLVFSNHGEEQAHATESWIYWGSESGFDPARRESLETTGASGQGVADLDRDGHLDLVIANFRDDKDSVELDSLIWWGSEQGYAIERTTPRPTLGADGVSVGPGEQGF
jgi:hypothetical protein